MTEKILKCEHAYLDCFCEVSEADGILTYSDAELLDMYSHNQYRVLAGADTDLVVEKLNQKLEALDGSGFCVCGFAPNFNSSDVEEIARRASRTMEISTNGCYVLDLSKAANWRVRKDCEVVPYGLGRLDDVLRHNLEMDGSDIGEDFVARRAVRKSKVFLNNPAIDNYLLYAGGEVVGACELFVHEGVAKIEDFNVLERVQRQGYGTTLLKHLVEVALSKGAETVYLIADEDDTAKEMYEKLGFEKIYEVRELTWADWMEVE